LFFGVLLLLWVVMAVVVCVWCRLRAPLAPLLVAAAAARGLAWMRLGGAEPEPD
jgi:hypothetical protein